MNICNKAITLKNTVGVMLKNTAKSENAINAPIQIPNLILKKVL